MSTQAHTVSAGLHRSWKILFCHCPVYHQSREIIVARFDGGLFVVGRGILVLREVEQRLRVADRLAACIADPRSPDQITHCLADIIRFRLLMIAAGYEDFASPIAWPPASQTRVRLIKSHTASPTSSVFDF